MPELLVAVAPLKSCFVSLPLRYANILWDQQTDPQNVIVEIKRQQRRGVSIDTSNTSSPSSIFCGWNGGCSQPLRGKDTLLLDIVWAQQLGLVHEQVVHISFHSFQAEQSPVSSRSPIASGGGAGSSGGQVFSAIGKQVFVEPVKVDDWEILELNAGYLEEQFLNQAKVVYQGEPLTIWLHNQTFINIKIVSIDPAGEPFVKLFPDSEIIVAPKKRLTTNLAKPADDQLKKTQVSMVGRVSASLNLNETPCLSPGCIGLNTRNALMADGSIVFIQNLDYDLLFPEPPVDDSAPKSPATSLVSRFAILKDWTNDGENIRLSSDVSLALSTFSNSKLRVIEVNTALETSASTIIINTPALTTSALKLTESVKDAILLLNPCVVHQHQLLDTPHGQIKLSFKATDDESTAPKKKGAFDVVDFKIVSSKEVASLRFEVQVNQSLDYVNSYSKRSVVHPPSLYGFSNVFEECLLFMEKSVALHTLLKLGTPSLGGLLIHGPSGCGKTALVSNLCAVLEKNQGLYTIKVKCDDWKGLNSTKLKSKLERLISKSIWHQPSLVFFEDLDTFLDAGDEHNPQATSLSLQASLLFLNLILPCLQTHHVFMVSTAKDKSTLNAALVKSHIFGHSVQVKSPNKQQRVAILEGLLTAEGNVDSNGLVDKSALELDDLSGRMEGYSVSDLKAVITQALQKKAVRRMATKSNVDKQRSYHITKVDFEQVLKTFKPISLSKSKLEESSVDWISIGGMHEAKEIILQTLKWPTKYARIFASSPLRLRSGILLYGYPGCGKTMLASAVAKECGLNFISVKGPELLNKYIGQSEKSVRDVFERAKSAAPCVLFFDEFESIAPRRGHDNSGVTDRVVNQFLTEMDGAEGLKGVYVLAATSRPDLIDPALLRPGRLDKAVLCDIPSENDRLEIIKTLTETSIKVHSSINLTKLSRDTVGFSGADLQGLLYSSQLLAINERLSLDFDSLDSSQQDDDVDLVKALDAVTIHGHIPEKTMKHHLAGMFGKGQVSASVTSTNKGKGPAKALQPVLVHSTHLQATLSATRPSILDEELKRLQRIYGKFAGKGYTPETVGSKSSHA